MKQTIKRLTALILAMAMALSLLSVSVWADELGGADASGSEPVAQTEGDGKEVEAPGAEDKTEADSSADGSIDVQDDGEYDDGEDIERSIDETPATPMPDISKDGDWRLPADACEVYLQCAQAIIDGKTEPDFDVHFEVDGITIDYVYNGDGTYTLSTAGDIGEKKSISKLEKDFNKKYKNNKGDSSYSRFRRGTSLEYNWLIIPANRSTPELQARYEEMVAFYDAVEEFITTRFKVTKIFCDSTYSFTKKYDPVLTYNNGKQTSITYQGVAEVFAPLNPAYDRQWKSLDSYWRNTVVDFTFGPHVQTASGVYGCPNLTMFNWGESKVTNILDGMFDDCPNLKEIRIPATVKLIGNRVFQDKNYEDDGRHNYDSLTYHDGYDGEKGDIGEHSPKDRTLIFEGDMTIGTYWSNSNVFTEGIKNVIAMGNLTVRAEADLNVRNLEVKGDLHLDDMHPGSDSKFHAEGKNHPIGSSIFAETIKVDGDAYFCGGGISGYKNYNTDDWGEYDIGQIKLIDIKGDLICDRAKSTRKLKYAALSGGGSISSTVKKMKVGGDLYLEARSQLPNEKETYIESVTVGGVVKIADPDFEKRNKDDTQYYPIKSHGTTTLKEGLKKIVLAPTSLSAKSNSKKTIKINWKPNNSNGNCTGYEIQYRLDTASGYWAKRNTKTIIVKNSKKKSITLSKLKSGKTYEIRMRALGKKGKHSSWAWFDYVKVK